MTTLSYLLLACAAGLLCLLVFDLCWQSPVAEPEPEPDDEGWEAWQDHGEPVGELHLGELHVNGITKPDGERYLFMYDDAHREEALRTLNRFALNPDLSFSWLDVAVVGRKIRQQAQETDCIGR